MTRFVWFRPLAIVLIGALELSSIAAPRSSPHSRDPGHRTAETATSTARDYKVSVGPTITATKVDANAVDVNGNTLVDPGDTIGYTVTISNSGSADATGVTFADTVDPNTSFVAGSTHASPLAANDSYTAIGNTQLVVGTSAGSAGGLAVSLPVAAGLLANDLTVTDTISVVPFSGATTHGTVAIASDGAFLYTPAAGFVGNDSFTYTVRNNAVPALTNSATATITISNRVWYVDNSLAPVGSGTSTAPFKSLGSVSGVDASGDYVYVFSGSGTYGSPLALKTSEKLIGNGVALVVGSVTLRSAGTRPTLGGTVTLASNVTIDGIDMSTGSSTALTGSGVAGLSVAVRNLSTTTGSAVILTGTGTADGTLSFTQISTNGAAIGVSLTTFNGAFTVNGDGTGRANGSGGTFANTTSRAVSLLTTSGTISLKSMGMQLNTSALSCMLVDNNAGGNVTVNVTGCTFTGVPTSASQNKALLQFDVGGTATVTGNVQGSFFNGSKNYGFFAQGAGTSVTNVTVNQCGFGTDVITTGAVNRPGTTITNPNAIGLNIGNGSSAQVYYTITNNTFWGANGLAGAIYAVSVSGSGTTAASHLSGSFNDNQIGKAGSVGSGCSGNCGGLGLLPGTSGLYNAEVRRNDIRQVNNMGITFANSASPSTITGIAHITGNTLAEPDTTGSPSFQRAITISPGNSAGASFTACAEVGGTGTDSIGHALANSISGAWQASAVIRITNANNTGTLTLPGLTPATGASTTQIGTFVSNNNGGVVVAATTGGPINGGAACSMSLKAGGLNSDDRLVSVVRAADGEQHGTDDVAPVSEQDLAYIVRAAIARLEVHQISETEREHVEATPVVMAELPDGQLASADGHVVQIDPTAAGHGWFVDASPFDDGEFDATDGRRMKASDGSPAAERMDLLSVVMRALAASARVARGTLDSDRGELGGRTLETGVRRLPIDVDRQSPRHAAPARSFLRGDSASEAWFRPTRVSDHELASQRAEKVSAADVNLTIATLQAGKSVTIQFRATVTGSIAVPQVANQGQVTAAGGISLLTDDPATGAPGDATLTPICLPITGVADPANDTKCAGQTASFRASASGSTNVTWQEKLPAAGSFVDIAGATSPTLTIAATAARSGAQYRAVFSNNCQTATTNPATLTVNAVPTISNPQRTRLHASAVRPPFRSRQAEPERFTISGCTARQPLEETRRCSPSAPSWPPILAPIR